MNYKIQLQGLDCDACKKITEKRIGRIEGVETVNVDLSQKTADVQASRALSQQEVEEALKDTEYKIITISEI